MTDNSLTFLPWIRNGINALGQIMPDPNEPDQVRRRVDVDLKLAVGQDGREKTYRKVVVLKGPGEVTGFSPLMVARTEPLDGASDFEPNYFAFIEFVDADFPWRYALHNQDDGRLIPWITLIVLKKDEFEYRPVSYANNPVIKVVKPVLPGLEQVWAWAHVQIAGNVPNTDAEIINYLSEHPEMSCSRIMCPRKLEQLTRYTAFVVPVYEMGRLAGLGDAIDASNVSDRFAWEPAQSDIDLPVYYSFEFQTSEEADFEELITRLNFVPSRSDLGIRPVDGSQPGFINDHNGNEKEYYTLDDQGVPTREVFLAEGALVPPGFINHEREQLLPGSFSIDLAQALRTALEEAPIDDEHEDPLVSLLVYGRYHRKAEFIELPDRNGNWSSNNSWFNELNLDRRARIAASTGTVIIQENQEEFMEQCWEQVGDITKANELVRFAAISNFVSDALKEKHFDKMTNARFVLITQPFHHCFAHNNGIDSKSYKMRFRHCGLPEGTITSTFRRILGTKTDLRFIDDRNLFHPWFVAGEDTSTLKQVEDTDTSWVTILSQLLFGDETRWVVPEIRSFKSEIVFTELIEVEKHFREAFNMREELLEWLSSVISAPWLKKRKEFTFLMKSPKIEVPMYRYLKEKSIEYLATGFGKLAQNSILLMEENRKFIEAYMVGLNHEMVRELVWREFPTDMRGTTFNFFWEPAVVEEPPQDIPDLHLWENPLGANKADAQTGNNLVLVLKSDLVRRYPQTIMFAIKAAAEMTPPEWEEVFGAINSGSTSNQEFQVILPTFFGNLGEDTLVLGLPFTEEEARTGAYYFVFMQHPSLPRFGVDCSRETAFTKWDDLTLSDLVVNLDSGWIDAQILDSQEAIDYNLTARAHGLPCWGSDAAAIAWITYQKPVRIVVPLVILLPEINGGG